jgi:glutamine amidotransferase
MTVIVDTRCANLSSIRLALERLDVPVSVSADAATIQAADRVILPGVGSATYAMQQLEQLDLIPVLQGLTQPLLGICLGMQLLMEHSQEGDQTCLGLIPGSVKRLQAAGLRMPHMGWNTLVGITDHPLFQGIQANEYVYFVHSYAVPVEAATVASCEYGASFSAAVARENIMGVQFHPERSSAQGLRILKNFMELT